VIGEPTSVTIGPRHTVTLVECVAEGQIGDVRRRRRNLAAPATRTNVVPDQGTVHLPAIADMQPDQALTADNARPVLVRRGDRRKSAMPSAKPKTPERSACEVSV